MSLKDVLSMEDFTDAVDNTSPASTDQSMVNGAQGDEAAGEVVIAAPEENSPVADAIEAAQADLEGMQETEVALEAYGQLLAAHANTGISSATAKAMQIGMQRYSKYLPNPVSVSLEALDSPVARLEANTQVGKNWKDSASELGNKIKEAITKLLAMLTDFFQSLFTDVGRLEARLQGLKQRAGEAANKNGTVTVKGAGPLMIGERFVGHDPKPVENLLVFLNTKYLPTCIKLADQYANVLAHSTNEAIDQFLSSTPPTLREAGTKQPLPGNYVLSPGSGDNGGQWRVSLALSGDGSDNTTHEVQVTGRELIGRINELLKTVGLLKQLNANGKKLASSLSKLREAQPSSNAKGLVVAGQTPGTRSTTAITNNLVAMAGSDLTKLSRYCYSVLGAMTAVADHELKSIGVNAGPARLADARPANALPQT